MTIFKESILFVDEDEIFCEGLLKFLNSQNTFEVVGVASEWSETLEKAETLLPEILILNIREAHADWIDTIRSIRQKFPFVTILVLSNNRKGIEALMNAGVNVFLSNELAFKDILHFIGLTNERSSMIYPQKVSSSTADPAPLPSEAPLSKREKEILTLVSKGLQNKEIAHTLSIKIQTVNNHLYNINRKLGCSNRTEAAFVFFNSLFLKNNSVPAGSNKTPYYYNPTKKR